VTATLENAIFRITSREENNANFGTGFIIKQDENASYLLTCAHVIEKVGGKDKVQVGGVPAEVVADGSLKGIDFVVLKIEALFELSILPLCVSKKKDIPCEIIGYCTLRQKSKEFVARSLNGVLTKPIKVQSENYPDATGWDLIIENGDFSLEPGYSGSPVIDRNNHILAVASHKQGKNGIAISINNLEKVAPEIFGELVVNSQIADSQMADNSRTPPFQDYQYDIFLSYVEEDEITQKWIHETFMPVFESYLKDFRGKFEVFSANQSKNGDFIHPEWKERLAYSRCLIPICSASYFKWRWSRFACSTMLFREAQEGCRTLDNPCGLFIPVVVSKIQLSRFTTDIFTTNICYFDCPALKCKKTGEGFKNTEIYFKFQDKMEQWIEKEVVKSIISAPSWKQQWLEELPEINNNKLCDEEQHLKVSVPNIRNAIWER
jgi:hypothetical protein